MSQEPRRFRNHYRCPQDGGTWRDTWSCMCNGRCPKCNAEIEPFMSEELCLVCGATVIDALATECLNCGEAIDDSHESGKKSAYEDSPQTALDRQTTAPIDHSGGEAWIVLVRHHEPGSVLAYEFASRPAALAFYESACRNSGRHAGCSIPH